MPCEGALYCQAEGGHGCVCARALKRRCIALGGPASLRYRDSGGVVSPQCTRTQRTFKEYLLESALATGLSRELAIAFTSANICIIRTIECDSVVISERRGMEGVRVVFIIDAADRRLVSMELRGMIYEEAWGRVLLLRK